MLNVSLRASKTNPGPGKKTAPESEGLMWPEELLLGSFGRSGSSASLFLFRLDGVLRRHFLVLVGCGGGGFRCVSSNSGHAESTGNRRGDQGRHQFVHQFLH